MKKILLVHGWNYDFYTENCKKDDSWSDKEGFVNLLSSEYEVFKLNFPGFCGQPEPDVKYWKFEDFVQYIEDFFQKNNFDAVLGFSFGGAVLSQWKHLYNRQNIPLILVAPAISRNYRKKSNLFILIFSKIFKNTLLKDLFAGWYLKYIVKNKYYLLGSKFLQSSYRNIVKYDATKDLLKCKTETTILVFGDMDTATPPGILLEKIKFSSLSENFLIIKGVNHRLLETHPKQVFNFIYSFIEKNKN